MEHMLRKFGREVDGVEYCIRRNGKVFWYYENGPVFEPVTQEEFQRFEVVHPAQRFPYHNDYYLAQMYGLVPGESPPYLMPLYLDAWDGSDECYAIQWAEWARYYHKMALNDEMRQAAIETAYYEGSLLWGPHWEKGFVPIRQYQQYEEHISQVQNQDQHRMDLDAGAQEILAIIHKTPESSPVKAQHSATKPLDEGATQTTPQGNGNKKTRTTSPLQSCLKTRADSNSSATSSEKSVRFADEVLLLELLHRGGRNCVSNQQEDIFHGQDEEIKEYFRDSDASGTKMQEHESAEPKQTGLMLPAIIHRSSTQLRENDGLERVEKESSNIKRNDDSTASLKDAKPEEIVANNNNQPIMGEVTRNEDIHVADPQSEKKKNTTPERSQNKVEVTTSQRMSAPMVSKEISTPVQVITRPRFKIKERSTQTANESRVSEDASKGKTKTLDDSAKAPNSGKMAWSDILASPPNSTKASQNSPEVSPTGWKTFHKAPKSPAVNWAEEVEEVAGKPVPATPARMPSPVKSSPISPLLQGGRASAEALNTDMGWTQPKPDPAPRASVSPPASLPTAAPPRAGGQQDNLGAGRRGGSGGGHAGQGRGGGGRSDYVPAGSSAGRREAGRGVGSGANGEKEEEDGGRGKREMPRWMKLRKERTWRGRG